MRNFKTRASDWQKVKDNKVVSREAAAAIGRAEISAAASRLRFLFLPVSRGLTPTATCCHRFAIPEMGSSKSVSEGLIYSLAYASGYDGQRDLLIFLQTVPLPNFCRQCRNMAIPERIA
jgi:hypothetical protein